MIIDESLLEDLSGINGYRASAITTNLGEVIISDTKKLKTDLTEVTATFNDIFKNAHIVSKSIGLGKLGLMEIHTDGAVALMVSSGEDSRIHLHGFAIFTKDGNITLAKLILNKILPKAVNILS